ncbi:hypothetical protein QH494_17020 [Sphingomonas sp. AR_OL41]|uniref:hypothetical protein n=1 Tax=Sphingomonas sp. AR_OL41 TaxID=3042729 RepID=UPI00248148EC|nr:hypothetical protein [Sphingomonas sp. AR_OL41]MDH7973895.1 hypothetical protein [Sphingomonas sp. AR_OL41]
MGKPSIKMFAAAIALAAMIGGFLILGSPQPPKPPVDSLSVVSAPSTVPGATWRPTAGPTATPIPPSTNATQRGEDPPGHYPPGAINYAEKGVVPAL